MDGTGAEAAVAVVVADDVASVAATVAAAAAPAPAGALAAPPRLAPLLSLRQLSRQASRTGLGITAPPPAPIPVVGISLDGILDFIAHCRSTAPAPPSATDIKYGAAEGVTFGLEECSTEVVKRQWMLSATALPYQQSYCELLTAQRSPHVGKPSVFVSHAWKYRFLDVVAALENWLAKGGKHEGHGPETPDAFLAGLLHKEARSSGGSASSTPRADSSQHADDSPRAASLLPKSSILSLLTRSKPDSAISAATNPLVQVELAGTPPPSDDHKAAAAEASGALSPAALKALRENTFFWFDIFSNSQHSECSRPNPNPTLTPFPRTPQTHTTVIQRHPRTLTLTNTDVADKPFEWWTEVFQNNVQHINHTLLVLEWENPIPLSRAWCIWEIFCTLNSGNKGAPAARLEIIMSAKEEETFNKALVDRFETVVKKVSDIDVARAVASVDVDRSNIFGAISKTLGVNEVTRLVVAEMRSWVADAGRRQLLKVASDRRALLCGPLVLKYSRLLSDLGRHDEATGLAEKALKGREQLLTGGDSNEQLVDAVDHLAYLTFYRGYMSGEMMKMPIAQQLYERAIRGRRKALADLESSPSTNVSATELAPGPAQTAAAELKLERQRALFTSLTFGGFCNFSGRSGNRKLAIRLIDEAWAGWSADADGDAHLGKHYCAWARAELLVFERHRLNDALQTAYVAFLRLQRLQGTLHPDTLYMMRLCSQGVYVVADFSTAVPTVRDSVQLLTRVLGSQHPYSRIAKGNMLLYVSQLGFLSEAELVGLESITQIQTIEGGVVNWTTLLAYANGGAAMRAKGTDTASAVYQEIKWECVAALFYLLDFSTLVEIGARKTARARPARRASTHPPSHFSYST
jgi:tetratricopeptide (TPR) repeat protein